MGYLASVDGLSGSGKSVAIAGVRERLKLFGLTSSSFHDRTGDLESLIIDRLQHGVDLTPEARLYLMLAVRRQVIDRAIVPSLDCDDVTLTDRYYPATIAYQAYGQGLDLDMVSSLAINAAHGAIPNRIFYLDIPAMVAKERVAARGGEVQVFDTVALSFHERVRRGYLAQASSDDRFRVIDGTQSVEAVADAIVRVILDDLRTAEKSLPSGALSLLRMLRA